MSSSIKYDRGLERKIDGLLCRTCHKRVPWRECVAEYSVENNDLIRRWVHKCGQTLREDNLTSMQVERNQTGVTFY